MTAFLTYEQQFTHYSRVKFNDLKRRSEPKFNHDKTRLLRAGQPVGFTLGEFRDWMLHVFGAREGQAQCGYCQVRITPATFVPDHDIPLARGGPNTLANLVACCETCNDIKGVLSGHWYRFLRKCLDEFPDAEADIIRARLAKSEKLAAQVRQLRGRQFAAKQNPQQRHEDTENF